MKYFFTSLILLSLFAGCKKDEFNCSQSQADYFLMCTQKNDMTIKLTTLKTQLKTATGTRRQYLIGQIDSISDVKTSLTDDMSKKLANMKDNGCSTNITDDCL